MTTRSLLLASLLACALPGCRGPKGSPEASVKSFYSAAVAQDFEAMAETLSADSRKKLGAGAAGRLANMFGGLTDVEVDVEDYSVDADGRTATVRFNCVSSTMVNYKPKKYDCSDTLQLVKEEDDKWHVVLAGGSRLRPM